MDYIEYDIKLSPVEPWSDVLANDLAEVGFDMFENYDLGLKAYIPISSFDENKVIQFLKSYEGPDKLEFEKKAIETINWNEEWEKNFSPINVENRCYLRASFHEKPKANQFEFEILINPKMSFGTGHHDTTYLMLKNMLDIDFKDKEVLDMGSGTGILAILACMKKAKKVVAIDIDDWAFENAKENAELNGCSSIAIEIGDVNRINKRVFDIVLANINLNVIKQDIGSYVKALHTGGLILFSGILEEDLIVMNQRLKNNGLSVLKQEVRGKWGFLQAKKM